MKIEVRKSGAGKVCDKCGATELVYAAGKPVATDLTQVLEREIVRRELGMARLFRDHLVAAKADQEARESRLADEFLTQLKDEHWRLVYEHDTQMKEVAQLLELVKVDVSRWRLMRRRRERIFAARVDAVLAEIPVLTRRGS